MQEFVLQLIRENAIDVIGIFVLFFLGRVLLKVLVKSLIKMVDDGDDAHASKKEKRAETLFM